MKNTMLFQATPVFLLRKKRALVGRRVAVSRLCFSLAILRAIKRQAEGEKGACRRSLRKGKRVKDTDDVLSHSPVLTPLVSLPEILFNPYAVKLAKSLQKPILCDWESESLCEGGVTRKSPIETQLGKHTKPTDPTPLVQKKMIHRAIEIPVCSIRGGCSMGRGSAAST